MESDSGSASLINVPQVLTAESVLFAHYTSRLFKIDLNTLRRRTTLDDMIAMVMTGNMNNWYKIGYLIAKAAIDGQWSPACIRKAMLEVFR